eukprot:PhF_6_TR25133/c1_g1_i1/m.34590
MFTHTVALLRRGKRPPKAREFAFRWRHVPGLLRPQQGGQRMFEDLLLQNAEQEAQSELSQIRGGGQRAKVGDEVVSSSPQHDLIQDNIIKNMSFPANDVAGYGSGGSDKTFISARQMEMRENDSWQNERGYNHVEWALKHDPELAIKASSGDPAATTPQQLPERVVGNDAFQEKFGYSLLKKLSNTATKLPRDTVDYQRDLDVWQEMPRYTSDMYFFYIISRRRNTYAVMFDSKGKNVHPTISVGTAGLKGGDRGWRSEGCVEFGHQVASKYLDLVYPKLVAMEVEAGRRKTGVNKEANRIPLVVRVMGFYNGRQGAMKAITDKSDKYQVRYLEDVTPVPRNGPRMPRAVF